jgi:hypothetical protein
MIQRIPTVAITGAGDDTVLSGALGATIEEAGRCVANAGCNLLIEVGSAAAELAAKAFCDTPYRVGSAIGIVPTEIADGKRLRSGATKRSQHRPTADIAGSWIDIRLSAPSDNSVLALSCDLMGALPGGSTAETQALELGKPVIALLGKGQKRPRHAGGSPQEVTIANNEFALAEHLATHLAPLAIARPTFNKLKNVYKTDDASVHSCTMSFPHTCAIRMSEALANVTPTIIDKFKASGLNTCPHNFMRGAQDLASVLRQADVFGVFNQGFAAPGTAPASVSGKKGIVCYMNIPGFSDGQGHIDLWDGSGPVGDAYWTGNPIWFWHLT